jgi:hypothetical protein
MNLNKLQKHYDKLTVEERVSAMIAAWGRDDMEEYRTLGQAAPFGKTFRLREHHGLLDALEWLAMWHVLMQLGQMATLYFLLFHGEEKIKVKGFDYDEAMTFVTKQIVEGAAAWREICKEHNMNPRDALNRLPFLAVVEYAEIIGNFLNIERNIQPEIDKAVEGYREVIKIKRGEWE